MEIFVVFVILLVCFVIIGIAAGISENRRMKREGVKPRDDAPQIGILLNIGRRKE